MFPSRIAPVLNRFFFLRLCLPAICAYLLAVNTCLGSLPSVQEVLESFKKKFSEAETVRAVYAEEFYWYPENVHRVLEQRFLIKGNWLFRVETYDAKTGKLEEVRSFNGKTRVMYNPDVPWAQIEPDKQSERCWHDLEIGRCLWDMLKDGVVNVRPDQTDDGVVIVEAETPYAERRNVGKTVATVSASGDFQLRELQLFSRDGFRFRKTEYKDYSRVEGDIWYPTEVVSENYATRADGQPYVYLRTKWVLKEIEVNKPIRDEEIQIDLPDGTSILDKTMGKELVYHKGEPLDERIVAQMELPGYRGAKLFLPLTSLGNAEEKKTKAEPPRQEMLREDTGAPTKRIDVVKEDDDVRRQRILFMVLVGLTILAVVYRIIWRRRFQRSRREG
jgi:outer membrane lipoprotein-sorting protein